MSELRADAIVDSFKKDIYSVGFINETECGDIIKQLDILAESDLNGLVNEEMGMSDSKFSDENGDGMNDRFTAREHSFGRGQQQMDIFIDKDGDGVADDRGMGVIRGKGKKKGKK